MTISEKVAYIQGMFDGMDLGKSESKEARILSEILDVLREVGEELETVDATLDEFGEEIDAISDDLADIEEIFEDEDDLDDVDEDDDFDEDDDIDEEEDFFEVDCPNCGEDLVIDDEVLAAGEIDCPNCGQKFALSFDEDEECCGGNCCCKDEDKSEE